MSPNELVNTTDGIAGHTDEVAGQEIKKSGLFRGTRLKFGKTAEWEIDGEAIDPETRLILIDVARIVTRWGRIRSPSKLSRSNLARSGPTSSCGMTRSPVPNGSRG